MNKNNYLSPKKTCEILGVYYKTLYKWEKDGKIDVIRTPGGKRFYNVEKYIRENININQNSKERIKICYCRVSTYNQKDDLVRQITYMKIKYPTHIIIKDIGSALNFKRKGLKKIIDYAINGEIGELVIAYKDRLCRFGYELIEYLINEYSNGKIIILNQENMSPTEEMPKDLVSIINIFSARINGLRKYSKKSKISKTTK